jgi:hypothetical protein
MTDRPRNDDNELIDELTDLPTPSHGNASGGDLAREIGQRDELQSADGEDPHVTRVRASDKPADGDAPTLPNRQSANDE